MEGPSARLFVSRSLLTFAYRSAKLSDDQKVESFDNWDARPLGT
jgi:hypothetical protein